MNFNKAILLASAASSALSMTIVPTIIEIPVPVYPENQQAQFGGGCSKANTEYSPLDMYGGGGRTEEYSFWDCQLRCQATMGCTVFSFWASDGGCHLHDAFAVPNNVLKPYTEATAGLAFCPNVLPVPPVNVLPVPVPVQAQCEYFASCTSCMDIDGCLWDDNWGKCRDVEACDYTEKQLPVAVPYALTGVPIDEQPSTNTVCLRSRSQCFTGGSVFIEANPNADRCSKIQSCEACIPSAGCVYDHHASSCVTYDYSMEPQCEQPWNPSSRFTCRHTGNCF